MKNKIIETDTANPDPNTISIAAQVIKKGGIVAFPTDTCYGLAVNPFDANAVDRLFEIKGRNPEKAFILLVSSIEMLQKVITQISPLQKSLIKEFWPGPLTLILKKNHCVPNQVGGKNQTIGVRYPKAELSIRLIEKVGFPLTATSANRSGERPSETAKEIKESIGEKLDLILDAGRCGKPPSTILDLTVTPPKLLRKGGLSKKQLERLF